MQSQDVFDRIEALESDLREIKEYALSPQAAGTVPEQPTWSTLSGWVITGEVFRDVGGKIVLDPSEPMIQVASGGYIQSSDYVAGTSGFQIDGGAAEFNDVTVRGTIYAPAGEIGGFDIGANTLTTDSGAVGLNSEATAGTDWRIWAGHASPGSAPFRVDESGNLVATSATITGQVTATSGEIGGWTVTATELHNSDLWLDADAKSIAVNDQTFGNQGFQVEYNSGTPRMYIGDGEQRYFEFDGTNVTIGGGLLVHGQLEASVLSYEAIQATSGSILVTLSAGRLLNDATTVASPTTFDLDIEDPEYGHVQLFSASDVLRLRKTDGTENWVTVSSVTDNTTYYTYTCTLSDGSATTFNAGTPVLNYGQSGDGLLYMSADDADAPFYSVRTWETNPWTEANVTEVVRIGNMRNAFGTGANDRYGFAIGDYSGGNYLSYNAAASDTFYLSAGGGNVALTNDGLSLSEGSGTAQSVSWPRAKIYGQNYGTYDSLLWIGAQASFSTGDSRVTIQARDGNVDYAQLVVSSDPTYNLGVTIEGDYPDLYVDGYVHNHGIGLMALSALPMSTGQVWVMPMARSAAVIETVPWGTNGTVNGTWRDARLSTGVFYNSFDGSNDWHSWADGTKTTPRYNLTWVGWVRFDSDAGGSAEMVAAQFASGDGCWFVDRRDSTNSGTLYAGYYISSTQYTIETTNEYTGGSWYCVGFTYNYDSDGGGLFVGKTDGTYEWVTNAQTGTLDNGAADFTVGAGDSGALKMDGDIARPWALMSVAVTESWFEQYLEMTRGLFS
jgi:hypothetical protein